MTSLPLPWNDLARQGWTGPWSVEGRSRARQTLLHWAVEAMSPHLSAIVEAGAALEAIDGGGLTPLLYAIKHNRLGAIETLLQLGASATAKVPDGGTVIHQACRYMPDYTCSLIPLLVQHGANVEEKCGGEGLPPLLAELTQARTPKVDVIEALLAAGARVDVTTPDGESPLGALLGYTNLLPGIRSTPPEDWVDVLQHLVAAGCSLDSPRHFARPPAGEMYVLEWAAKNAPQWIPALLDAGASPNIVSKDEHQTPLIWLALYSDKGRIAALEEPEYKAALDALMDVGACWNAKDSYGDTAWDIFQRVGYPPDSEWSQAWRDLHRRLDIEAQVPLAHSTSPSPRPRRL